MVPWLPPLSLPAGYILAGLLSCNPQAPPTVDVQFQNEPPQIDNSRSQAQMTQMKERSSSPNYGAEFPIVAGLTDSHFEAGFSMEVTNATYPGDNSACLWAKTINITVAYTPTIYVSSSYRPGSCRYKLTEGHEIKHVGVDVITLKEYLPRFRQAAEAVVADWHGMGPIDRDLIKANQESMSKTISEALKDVSQKMQETRRARQQQVDSRDEYRYISEACQGER